MSKVIKIILNFGYTPIDKKLFKVGTCIDFNCYIQRFNGYVVIIEAGTFLDKKLYERITSNNLQVFVQNESYNEYKQYTQENKKNSNNKIEILDLSEEVKNSLNIDKILSKEKLASEKLKTIYFIGNNLINSWLLIKNKKRIPLDAFECLIENIVEIVNENDVRTFMHK